jgi:hypothetical protein
VDIGFHGGRGHKPRRDDSGERPGDHVDLLLLPHGVDLVECIHLPDRAFHPSPLVQVMLLEGSDLLVYPLQLFGVGRSDV